MATRTTTAKSYYTKELAQAKKRLAFLKKGRKDAFKELSKENAKSSAGKIQSAAYRYYDKIKTEALQEHEVSIWQDKVNKSKP